MEERIMTRIDDLEAQFIAAINSIAQELQTEVSQTEDAVAARFQPFADRLTALGSNPTEQVPAASGNAGGGSSTGDAASTGTTSGDTGATGAGTSSDSGSGGSASSNDAGAPPADGSTGSTASA
jgi:hypothetical protein